MIRSKKSERFVTKRNASISGWIHPVLTGEAICSCIRNQVGIPDSHVTALSPIVLWIERSHSGLTASAGTGIDFESTRGISVSFRIGFKSLNRNAEGDASSRASTYMKGCYERRSPCERSTLRNLFEISARFSVWLACEELAGGTSQDGSAGSRQQRLGPEKGIVCAIESNNLKGIGT